MRENYFEGKFGRLFPGHVPIMIIIISINCNNDANLTKLTTSVKKTKDLK